MTISTAITDRQDVIAIPGAATETTCNVLIVVRHPSATQPDITLTVNGTTYDNTDVIGGQLTQYGTDHADGVTQGPMWAGVIVVSGLSSFNSYPFTVDDTTNGTSNTGTLRTAPSATDDFTLFCGTCFGGNKYQGSSAGNVNGMFSYIRNYISGGSGLPVAAYAHVDDIWYVGDNVIDDTLTTDGTDLLCDGDNDTAATNPGLSSYAYDWAVGYLSGFGMLGPAPDSFTAGHAYTYGIYGERGDDKIWCSKNVNFVAQWGDHEIANDVGWDTPYTGAGAATASVPAGTLWDATFGKNGLMYGTAFDAGALDTVARHWKLQLGCMKIIAPDGISNGSATTIPGSGGLGSALTQEERYTIATMVTDANVYGDNQVLDILDALDTSDGFKLLLMDKGIKYPSTVGQLGLAFTEFQTGEQHPIKNHCAAMYSNLMTKDAAHVGGQKSIMLNGNTNGAFCTTFVVTGDLHNSAIYRNHAASGAGDLAEEIVSINAGTMNSTLGIFKYDSTLTVGEETDQECTPLWLSGYPDGGALDLYWVVQLEVYGSRSPKECHVKIIDKNEETVFHKKFIQYRGNLLWDADTEVAHIAPVSADE